MGDMTSSQGFLFLKLILEFFMLNLKIKRKAEREKEIPSSFLQIYILTVPMHPVIFSGFQNPQFYFLE